MGKLRDYILGKKDAGGPGHPGAASPGTPRGPTDFDPKTRRSAVFAPRTSVGDEDADGAQSVFFAATERRLPTEGGPPAAQASPDVAAATRAFSGVALFESVSPEDRAALFDSLFTLEYAPRALIMRQGEKARNFYVVVSGECEVWVRGAGAGDGDALLNTLGPGDTFGERALLHGGVRSASVSAGAGGKVVLWALGARTFRQTLSSAAFERRRVTADLLAHVKPLAALTAEARERLADAAVSHAFAPEEVVLCQGSAEGARFHIIVSGSVAVSVAGRRVAELGAGEYFGEVCLLEAGAAPSATVAALDSGVRTLSLDRPAFNRMLGDEVQAALAEHIRTYEFAGGGGGGGGGRAAPAAAAGGGEPAAAEPAAADAAAAGAAAAAAAAAAPPSSPPEAAASPGVPRAAAPGLGGGAAAAAPPPPPPPPPPRFAASPPRAERPRLRGGLAAGDLVALKKLGEGMTSTVYLCRVPTQGGGPPVLAVVKIMSKVKMLSMSLAANVVTERTLQASWDCPQIVAALGAFQDRTSLYLVLDFCEGGDLFHYLYDARRFSLAASRFYAAEVLLALGYIHAADYIYRDLKPENLLMDAKGHVLLADLGFTKLVRGNERTYTCCGTFDYMAPEVMLNQGHNRCADFWSFGVLIFEMLTGGAPFAGEEDARMAKILSGKVVFPPDFPPDARDCVTRLCQRDISRRLGMMARGIEELRDHAFFADVDWEAMAGRHVPPPYVPAVRSQQEWDARPAVRLPEGVALDPRYEGAFVGF